MSFERFPISLGPPNRQSQKCHISERQSFHKGLSFLTALIKSSKSKTEDKTTGSVCCKLKRERVVTVASGAWWRVEVGGTARKHTDGIGRSPLCNLASPEALRQCRVQWRPPNELKRCGISRLLSLPVEEERPKAESKYAWMAVWKEMLHIVFAAKKFYKYLIGRHFELVTIPDH